MKFRPFDHLSHSDISTIIKLREKVNTSCTLQEKNKYEGDIAALMQKSWMHFKNLHLTKR
ncbi:hypothetical protein [Thalassobacillus sp. C254]|uniref:hypothetical protein n=1 Tax=Thalassobacillus sp. C254 TaxID=1225341 RepID=UPI0006CFC087|nr:hypothetical protein [Thalassobacillus sp. C254]